MSIIKITKEQTKKASINHLREKTLPKQFVKQTVIPSVNQSLNFVIERTNYRKNIGTKELIDRPVNQSGK